MTERGEVQPVGTLELRAELPVVIKERVLTGRVTFRREVRTRTETLTTELRQETLVIEVAPSTNTGADSSTDASADKAPNSRDAAVFFNGELLLAGESREVLLYDERAVLSKQVYVAEEVKIGKQVVSERQEHALELAYEVLESQTD